jgi:hypothetical protein
MHACTLQEEYHINGVTERQLQGPNLLHLTVVPAVVIAPAHPHVN